MSCRVTRCRVVWHDVMSCCMTSQTGASMLRPIALCFDVDLEPNSSQFGSLVVSTEEYLAFYVYLAFSHWIGRFFFSKKWIFSEFTHQDLSFGLYNFDKLPIRPSTSKRRFFRVLVMCLWTDTCLVWCHVVSCDTMLCHMTPCCLAWCHALSHDTMLCHRTSCCLDMMSC